MATRLFWLERVVRNSAALIVVLAAVAQTEAQSMLSKKISFCCNSSDFEKIIEDLEKATGVHFVYSSNKIQASQQVTLSVKNKPLKEVLDVLSNQLNLSFNIQEHYITIKSRGVQYQSAVNELPSLKRTVVPSQINAVPQDLSDKERHFGKRLEEKMSNATTLSSNDGVITPYVAKLKPYVDPTFLKKVPIQYLKSTSNKLRVDHGWFVSVGSVVNEYSAGAEIQAGLRYAYVVFSPTWLRDDQYHGGLGLGSSLQLSNVFSLRPVYTYASLRQTKMQQSNVVFAKSPGYQMNTATDHHQFKLMVQYDISKKFKFRIGPTFNQSRATISYQLRETIDYYRTNTPPQYYQPDPGSGTHVVFRNTVQAPPSITSNKFWVGWEASLSYRINFK